MARQKRRGNKKNERNKGQRRGKGNKRGYAERMKNKVIRNKMIDEEIV